MSEEIIKVLNYISEKLGITIDWTADNVIPKVMEILERYRIYMIISCIIEIVILIIAIIGAIIMLKKIYNGYSKKSIHGLLNMMNCQAYLLH